MGTAPNQPSNDKKKPKPYTTHKTDEQSADESALNVEIGMRIRRARIVAKLSLDTLSGRIGVSYQQLQKYESGSNRISVSSLIALCRALDLAIDDILSGISSSGSDIEGGGATSRLPLDVYTVRIVSALDRLKDRRMKLAIVRFLEAFLPVRNDNEPGDQG